MQLLLPTTSSPTQSHASAPPSLGWMLLLGAALFALALPIVGPLDDHHFAERTHTHAHIYLNGRPAAHGHAYESGLRHLHPSAARTADDSAANRSHGVVYLTPSTASLMLAVMSAPYHTAPNALRPPPPKAQNANPLTRFTEPSGRPDGAVAPPPLPPPVV